MTNIFTYKDLLAWQKSMDLVETCYPLTTSFPRSELYGLTSQLRRAAVSIPSNVAEGHCRRTTPAFLNHVSIALGSHGEFQTCLEIARRLGFLTQEDFKRMTTLSDTVGRLLYGLYNSLEKKFSAPKRPSDPQPLTSNL